VAIFLKRLLADQPATINGDGRYIRDYVYASDVARANILALTASDAIVRPGTVTALNIGTGIGVDVVELEGQIRAALGARLGRRNLPAPLHGPARPGDLRSNLVDPSRAARLFAWRPEVRLEDGLARTATWFAGAG
jgi:UDP-glucose 4-epimerase